MTRIDNILAGRLTRLTILGNLAGALLSFVYFNFLDPSAHEGAPRFGFGGRRAFFVVSFALLAWIGRTLGVRWSRPVIEIRGCDSFEARAATSCAGARSSFRDSSRCFRSSGGWRPRSSGACSGP